MASEMASRRLRRELQALVKNPMKNPRVHAVPNEANILEWHYVLEGVADTPYEGGYYHGKLIFPKEYPLKPPSVLMLTPNGRFRPNRRLCLSMSDFHPESWNPMWSVSTILTGLYSFMVETAPTLGSVETSDSQKRRFAYHSLEFNVQDSNFCKLFPELVETYHKQKEQRQLQPRQLEPSTTSITKRRKKGIRRNPGEADGVGGIGLRRALLGVLGEVGISPLFAGAAGIIAVFSILFAFCRFL